ncbi:GAF domain-containing protein [Actinoplanes sp. HUAS TT8]|uniref:GAF domain-containing protein n=1 Tax=Actinoplanes sp. HUAS TT8 TaxID=3447453 RepID=UPI003F51CC23
MQQTEREAARLAAVDSYGLVGGARPEILDGLTRIATEVFDTPMASVTLVHREQQWFAGSTGLAEPGTSRAVSFSARLLDDPRPLVVADTRDDPLFRYLPHVNQAPPICFYAGVPLIDADGHVLGSVAVFDHRPRLVGETRMALLESLSAQAGAYLQARRNAEVLASLRARLGRLRDQEDDVIAAVSHELRTPVATMLGYVEMLGDLAGHQDLLEPLGQAGHQLIHTLERILGIIRSNPAS